MVTHVGIRSTRIRTLDDTEVIIPNGQISNDIIDNFSKREYRRIKSKFLLDNATDKQTLDDLEREITLFLEKDKNVINIDILIGVREYTMFGIEFGVTFYVDAQNKVDYTLQQHRLLSDIAKIIREKDIELVSMRDNMIN
jgi:MscS family membrane protein